MDRRLHLLQPPTRSQAGSFFVSVSDGLGAMGVEGEEGTVCHHEFMLLPRDESGCLHGFVLETWRASRQHLLKV